LLIQFIYSIKNNAVIFNVKRHNNITCRLPYLIAAIIFIGKVDMVARVTRIR